MSRVTSHMSGVTCHVSHVSCHVWHVTCHVSHVTCHLSLTPTATATDLPLLTPSAGTSWLWGSNQQDEKNVTKIVATFEPIIQFWCPSRLRILRTIPDPFILWEKKEREKTWYFGRSWQLPLLRQTHRQTHTQTDIATLWPTDPALTCIDRPFWHF